jgi:hypothetical protein
MGRHLDQLRMIDGRLEQAIRSAGDNPVPPRLMDALHALRADVANYIRMAEQRLKPDAPRLVPDDQGVLTPTADLVLPARTLAGEKCPRCGGSGTDERLSDGVQSNRCPDCRGTGRKPLRRKAAPVSDPDAPAVLGGSLCEGCGQPLMVCGCEYDPTPSVDHGAALERMEREYWDSQPIKRRDTKP